MLAVQVSYWNYLEAQRHNVETEQYSWSSLQESVRHNVVSEQETQRHNVATEQEINRHNLVTESQTWTSLAETERHNRVQENIGFLNASAALQQAQAALWNAQTNEYNSRTQRYAAEQNVRQRQEEIDISYDKYLSDFITANRRGNASEMSAEASFQNSQAAISNSQTNYARYQMDYEEMKSEKASRIQDTIREWIYLPFKIFFGSRGIMGGLTDIVNTGKD